MGYVERVPNRNLWCLQNKCRLMMKVKYNNQKIRNVSKLETKLKNMYSMISRYYVLIPIICELWRSWGARGALVGALLGRSWGARWGALGLYLFPMGQHQKQLTTNATTWCFQSIYIYKDMYIQRYIYNMYIQDACFNNRYVYRYVYTKIYLYILFFPHDIWEKSNKTRAKKNKQKNERQIGRIIGSRGALTRVILQKSCICLQKPHIFLQKSCIRLL